MTALLILMLQWALTAGLTFYAVVVWGVPAMHGRSDRARLTPLLFVHAFRFVPLMMLQPGQLEGSFPADLARLIAFGDTASALAAIGALVLWQVAPRLGRPATWLFSLIGTADMLVVLVAATKAQVWTMPLGAIYPIPVFYVPVLVVLQGLIFVILFERGAEA